MDLSSKHSIINIYSVFIILLPIILIQCVPKSLDEIPYVLTVTGPIPADSLGLTLIHEHVFIDWRLADETVPADWDNDDAFHTILPFLLQVKDHGVRSFLECTPEYLGRNPTLIKRLSDETGLHILTNTGFYGFRQNSFIPKSMQSLKATELAEIWIDEFENGIGETGLKPGFIKISVEPDSSLSDFHKELVRAAAITHRKTGLTIVSHTGIDTTAALQIAVLYQEGVSPEAFVWTHAQNGTAEGHLRMARKGAWISLDGLGWVQPAENDSSALFRDVDFLVNLKEHDLLDRTLISHDAGWYEYEREFEYKGYTDIFTLLRPVLLKNGFTEEDFYQMMVMNPKRAYALRKRTF